MVQDFRVLRCYSCEVFQVDQVKKVNDKWVCKVCNEKQSVKQVFFYGSGKECRKNCQMLNMRRQENNSIHNDWLLETENIVGLKQPSLEENAPSSPSSGFKSKWLNFVERQHEDDDGNDSTDVIFRGEEISKKKRKYSRTDHTINNKSILKMPDSESFETKNISKDNINFCDESEEYVDGGHCKRLQPSNLTIPRAANNLTDFECCFNNKKSKWIKFLKVDTEDDGV